MKIAKFLTIRSSYFLSPQSLSVSLSICCYLFRSISLSFKNAVREIDKVNNNNNIKKKKRENGVLDIRIKKIDQDLFTL